MREHACCPLCLMETPSPTSIIIGASAGAPLAATALPCDVFVAGDEPICFIEIFERKKARETRRRCAICRRSAARVNEHRAIVGDPHLQIPGCICGAVMENVDGVGVVIHR